MSDQIPTTIITGFLGSGKTTIIQNAIKDIWEKEKIAIIKNEISDVGVDDLELSDPKLTVTELPNGCICCTLVGALNEAIVEIIQKYSPDRLIIEASGLAKPAQIAVGLELIKDIYVDGVIIVIDSLNYKKYSDIEKSFSGRVQSEMIDLFILNKVNEISEIELDLIKDDILGNNPIARIIETNDANIPASIILGVHPKFESFEITHVPHDHDLENYQSFYIENFSVKDTDEFTEIFNTLPRNIYRIKGYFCSANKNYIFNYVSGRTYLKETDKTLPTESKLIFIGKDIDKYYPQILKKFGK